MNIYIRTISNAWTTRTCLLAIVPLVLKRYSLFSKTKRSHRARKGERGPERGAATKARSIVSDKTRKPRDHRRHYHNVRATYRMTREAPGTQRAPALTPLTPAVFVRRPVRRESGLWGPKLRNMPTRCATDIPAEGPAVTEFTDVVSPRRISDAKRDTCAGGDAFLDRLPFLSPRCPRVRRGSARNVALGDVVLKFAPKLAYAYQKISLGNVTEIFLYIAIYYRITRFIYLVTLYIALNLFLFFYFLIFRFA